MLMLPLQATLGRTMNITEGMLKREKVNEVLPQILDWKSWDSNTIYEPDHCEARWMRIFSHQNKHKSFISTFFFFLASIFLFDLEGNSWESKYIYLSFFSPLKQTLIFYADTLWLICQNMSSIHTLFIQRFHAPHTAHMPGLVGWFTSPTYKKNKYIYTYMHCTYSAERHLGFGLKFPNCTH